MRYTEFPAYSRFLLKKLPLSGRNKFTT